MDIRSIQYPCTCIFITCNFITCIFRYLHFPHLRFDHLQIYHLHCPLLAISSLAPSKSQLKPYNYMRSEPCFLFNAYCAEGAYIFPLSAMQLIGMRHCIIRYIWYGIDCLWGFSILRRGDPQNRNRDPALLQIVKHKTPICSGSLNKIIIGEHMIQRGLVRVIELYGGFQIRSPERKYTASPTIILKWLLVGMEIVQNKGEETSLLLQCTFILYANTVTIILPSRFQ